MSKGSLKLIGLIPAYNAGDTVAQVVAGTLRQLPEVVVVDDGSVDGTAKAAREAGAFVISHPANMGKGAALRTGFEHALARGCDGILTLDADTQHDPDEIPKLIAKADETGAGITIGARLKDKEKIPPARYWTNMVGVTCISWRAKNRLEDSQSGFRIYRAEVLRGMKYTSSRFETETELLIRAGKRGFNIASVPVRTIYSEEILRKSHYRKVRDTYLICMMFLKSFLWFRP